MHSDGITSPAKPCLVEPAAGTLGRGFLEELTTSWLLSFPLLARGAREDSVSQPGVHMHVPEGNVLHLPYMGHPNTWQVHVGAVVHVGMWIRCFQALCVPCLAVSPPFPPCPGQRSSLQTPPAISPWLPRQTGRAVCCSCEPQAWPGLAGIPHISKAHGQAHPGGV